MDSLTRLSTAIERRRPVSFEYLKPGKTEGTRYGHPHAIFRHPTSGSVLVHIWQTDGVSDAGEVLPSWRTFTLDHLVGVELLADVPAFNIAPDYKRDSPLYSKAIKKL